MEKVIDFITQTSIKNIPEEAVANAKKCILDGLAVALAGSTDSSSRIVRDYVRETGAKPEAGVFGSGFFTDCAGAAMVNGTMTHALDFDDTSESLVHFTSVLMPVVLALGQHKKVSGQKALEAYIIGWEVGAKIGDRISDEAAERGWHTTSAVGCLAAAISASKLIDLNAEQTRNALGIVASHASGLMANYGTDTKPLHSGIAARSGIVAAILASRGFSGNKSVLSGPVSLPVVLSGLECDMEQIGALLGNPYSIVSPGPKLKLYPSCGTNHASITATLELCSRHSIKPEDVSEVECRVSHRVATILSYDRPQSAAEAKFSMQYCVARALLDGTVNLQHFAPAGIASQSVQALMSKIKMIPDNRYSGDRPQLVTITLKDGKSYSYEARFSKGNPENPLSMDDIYDKFRDCVETHIDAENIKLIYETVLKLDSIADVGELANLAALEYK